MNLPELLTDLAAFVQGEYDVMRESHVCKATDTVYDENAIDALDEMQKLLDRTRAAIADMTNEVLP